MAKASGSSDGKSSTKKTALKAPPPHATKARNTEKQEKETQKARDEVLGTVESFLASIRKFPTLWLKKEFGFVRDFVTHVSNDPTTFPPNVSTIILPTKTQSASLDHAEFCLTKGFVNSVYDRSATTCIGQVLSSLPVVQVTHVTPQVTKHDGRKMIKYTINIADFGGDWLTLKVDTGLNNRVGCIEPGLVMRLVSYEPIYYAYEQQEQCHVTVLLSRFQALGMNTVDTRDCGLPSKRLTVADFATTRRLFSDVPTPPRPPGPPNNNPPPDDEPPPRSRVSWANMFSLWDALC
jgi:hypothetical protein